MLLRFVDMHQALVEQAVTPTTTVPFTHAGTDRKDKVDRWVAQRRLGGGMAAETEYAAKQRMTWIDQALAIRCRDERCVAERCELQDRADPLAAPATDQQHHVLCFGEHATQRLDSVIIDQRRRRKQVAQII